MPEKVIGLDDNTIINAVLKTNPNLGGCVVIRGKADKKSPIHKLTSCCDRSAKNSQAY